MMDDLTDSLFHTLIIVLVVSCWAVTAVWAIR